MTLSPSIKRPLVGLLAALVVVTGLTLAPISVSTASAASSSSSAKTVLSAINKYRVAHNLDKYKSNGFLQRFTNAYLAVLVKHKNTNWELTQAEAESLPDIQPGVQSLHTPRQAGDPHLLPAYGIGGSNSGRPARMGKLYVTDAKGVSAISDTNNYAAVSYFNLKGSKSFVLLVAVSYAATPDDYQSESPPTITGKAAVGKTLTAVGHFSPAIPANSSGLHYTWNVAGVDVPSHDSSTYIPTVADIGHTIKVTVKGTLAGYVSPAAKTSKATANVVKGTITGGKFLVTGTRKVGRTLTAEYSGDRVPVDSVIGATYWLRNGKKIAGSEGTSYVLKKADLGKKIDAAAVATRDGYVTRIIRSTTKTKTAK